MALSNFKLENLPRRIQIALLAILAIGLAAVFYVYFLKDMVVARSALQTEIARLEREVAKAAAAEAQLTQFKSELKELDARLAVLRRILPAEKETPEVLRSVQLMAAESNLKIVRFVPQPVAPRAFYSDWPITMEVQGSYNALGKFFEKVGQFTRIVNVNNISIKGIEGSTDPARTLNSNCTATTFVYREDVTATPGK
ncbi:MAG: Pilus assembly protein, PilO [Acidobacteria bacterium]|nr:Pilus assembly protein, PilO [Acidobacteriota bacterium]